MFRYKQFTIEDANSAMKVGTDGTLLGCWVNISEAKKMLDVGCGSGVLAAICAQKNDQLFITGIDVESGAIFDAKSNVSKLPDLWRMRINILHARLQDFKPEEKFDLIISNPPFFENSQISPDDARNFARHTNSLHYREVLTFASCYLEGKGKINLILPYQNGLEAIEVAKGLSFYPSRVCTVYPVPHKPPHRLLIELSRTDEGCEETELIIETGVKRHDYTREYQELGKDFYLYF